MTAPATLARALAFVAITGSKTGFQRSTRLAMLDFSELTPYTVNFSDGPVTLHKYTLTEEGQRLAETSQLWKAHAALVAKGFRIGTRLGTRQKPNHLQYVHEEHERRSAFISGGVAFAQRAPDEATPEGARPWDYVKVEA